VQDIELAFGGKLIGVLAPIKGTVAPPLQNFNGTVVRSF